MSHMVIFRTPEGKPGYQPADTVQDAVAVVERLRNDEGVENVRIFRLEELTFEYRPYYKVELAGVDTGSGSSAEPEASEPVAALGDTEASDDHVEPASADAIDVNHEEVEASAEGDAGADTDAAGDFAEPVQASDQPPWAAPPPPPPGAPTGSVFGGTSNEDEFTSSQRRGLFGR